MNKTPSLRYLRNFQDQQMSTVSKEIIGNKILKQEIPMDEN